ncbi:hypothetical protein P3T76_015711 [Phytophthora citrophthora]|uniref:Uncharacterized protein n=1 Tax=Phytophthora citrophthora TaxID=4793 RepID=A0AAD9FYU0_9STRA|nr:hypothetical protein P3T76_015711 [Phytophthora citrophthora]
MSIGGIGDTRITSEGSQTMDLRCSSVSYLLSVEQQVDVLNFFEGKASAVHRGRKWAEICKEMKARHPKLDATKVQLQSLCSRGRKKRKQNDLKERDRCYEELEKKNKSSEKKLEENNEEKNKILDHLCESEIKVQQLENLSKEKDDLEARNKKLDALKVERAANKKEIDDLKMELARTRNRSMI